MQAHALRQLNPESKALIMAREFLTGHMSAPELRAVLDDLLKGEEERPHVLRHVENALRAQSTPDDRVRAAMYEWGRRQPRRPAPPPQPLLGLPPGPNASSAELTDTRAPTPRSGMMPPPANHRPTPRPGRGPVPAARTPVSSSTRFPGNSSGIRKGVSPRESGVRSAVSPSRSGIRPASPSQSGRAAASSGMLPAVSLPRGPLPKRVLLAEDDRHARLLWKRALSEQGFQVLEAGNGVDAWKLIHSAPLGGLILDMRLPGMHGLEILTRMQEQNKVLPVVVCSALGQVQDDPVLRGYPLLQFLLKPVEPEQITGALEDLRAQVAG